MDKPLATICFAASSASSLLGNSVAAVALPLAQLAITGDALAAGIVALACMMPQIVAGLFGGALLDRSNRRNVSIAADFVSALSVAALPLVDMTFGLSLGWFIALGVLGALGDVPGMTARDALVPAIAKRDGIDLQQFMGMYGAVESLAVVLGPALAALAIGFLGPVNALWITAGMSLAAAGISFAIPREIGCPSPKEGSSTSQNSQQGSPLAATVKSSKEGLRILFASNPMLRFSAAAIFAVVMVIGALQGIVLPVHYTNLESTDLLGYVLSALSLGSLVGSAVYAQFAHHLRNRTWYALSLTGMAAAVTTMCALPSHTVMLASAAALGFFSGPISALMGYISYEIIPEEKRGAALGMQNSLMLMVSPLAIFAASALIKTHGVATAAALLNAVWLALTLYALIAKSMRDLDSQRTGE